jgi:hypothetical protein
MSEEDSEWIKQLPELEGLFVDHGKLSFVETLEIADDTVTAAALVRPFSLLSLPFFRRKPPTPSKDPLTILRSASAFIDSGETVDYDTAVKVLVALRTYIVDLKTDAAKSIETLTQGEQLLEVYLRGFCVAARAASEGRWNREMAEASKDCLMGYLQAHRQASEETKHIWRPHILAAIFPPSPDDSHLLTPVFDLPRQLTEEILHHHMQRPGGKKALRDSAGEELATDPVAEHGPEAESLLDSLSIFSRLVAALETLPLSTRADVPTKTSKAKLKARDDEAKRRPLRIGLETRITQCELATALASVDVVNIKVRARGKSRSPTPELLSDEGSSVESDDEVDVKPDFRSQVSKSPEVLRPDDESKDDKGENGNGGVWDEKAEDILYDLLEYSRQLIDDRHSSVLTDTPQRAEWLGTIPSPNLPRTPTPKTPGSASEDSNESESESDSDSDSDLDPSSSQAGSTPLRAIFRLQDRYEELRLAVWLSLPPDSRGKMSAYMRGAPTPTQMLRVKGPNMGAAKFKEMMNGRIGEAWDRLGMALLKKFDR